MSNVISIKIPARMRGEAARHGALAASFAENRRHEDDVFWLKENAELLNILECTGKTLDAAALDIFVPFYQRLAERIEFFPQYYRFYLSLALDLEALGMDGDTATSLVDFALREGLAETELSDLQRMEARRLMARRGRIAVPDDTGLEARIRRFTETTSAFMLPNKKAAYELTHTVFYLSEYGRKDPNVSDRTITSLICAGLLAFLDLNADLLAEICVSLRFAGEVPPPSWTEWLHQETARFDLDEREDAPLADDYHEFLVCNWHEATSGGDPFRKSSDGGRVAFLRGPRRQAPLRQLSECLYALGQERSNSWDRMRDRVNDHLSEEAREVLIQAEASSPVFERFFEGFARTRLRPTEPV